jgi:hypothetical protein
MDDPNQINPPQNTSDNNPQINSQEYQDILDKYAKEIAKNPPESQTPPEPNIDSPSLDIELTQVPSTNPIPSTPTPQPEFEFPQPPPQATPATPDLPHELPPPLPPKDDIEPPIEEIPPSKPNPFLKLLFFISLLVFLAVILGLVYVYLIAPAQISQQNLPQTDQNTPTSVPSGVCLLNDQSFDVGQSFPSADGCNTCTCQEDLTISCTEIACDSTSSTIPSDWKTYSNSSFGITIKYPQTVTTKDEMDDQYNRKVAFIGDNLDFTVTLRKADPNFILSKYFFMDSPISRTSTLGGKEANVYELPKGYCDGPSCSQPYIAIVTEHNGDIYSLAFFGDSKLSNQESQILSTFKFL